ARKFEEILNTQEGARPAPLRMCLTGPGGTGKTYVVNSLKELMKHYGRAHEIRFLAPTGGAAKLIGGQTIHSGLGISIAGNKSDREASDWDLRATITPAKKAELTAEWKNVTFVLVDEVSMVGQDLLCELDSVL
ncbi:hypothetical protein DL93DRAFT_2045564, partial [Clavulina sp. PMI_390]